LRAWAALRVGDALVSPDLLETAALETAALETAALETAALEALGPSALALVRARRRGTSRAVLAMAIGCKQRPLYYQLDFATT
jgi:hypothetical protein